MNDALCWMTDYYAPECWLRACVHSDSPTLPCRGSEQLIEKETCSVD